MTDWPWEKREALYRRAFNYWGKGAQFLMAVEEMAELTLAITKFGRCGGDAEATLNLMEEIGDVEIMLEQLRVVFADITAPVRERNEALPDIGIDSIKAKKLKRLAEVLDAEEQAR